MDQSKIDELLNLIATALNDTNPKNVLTHADIIRQWMLENAPDYLNS